MPFDFLQRAIILTGPTASGKTALALQLAPRLDAEIIAMDSMTLYRRMDIGTAKPSLAERALVPHHLIDVLEPWESASVAWWLEQAEACVRDIETRGRRVLFVGGTPLYLKAILRGLFDGPPADPALRARLEQADGGTLHPRLRAVDPASAERLHPNDKRRIIRALEVFELTGQPLSAWQTQWRTTSNAADSRCLCITLEREELQRRIDRRVDQMFDAGFLDEVRALMEMDRPLSREASQAVGYREALDFLANRYDRATMVERMRLRSRQLAKRQQTWFRAIPECIPVGNELTDSLRRLKIEEE